DIGQYPAASFSLATFKILAQRDLATLVAAFVIAFAVLSFTISILAFRLDLHRLAQLYAHLSRTAPETPANIVGNFAIENAARKIGDAIRLDPITGRRINIVTLDMQRTMRLETQRVYVQRFLLLQTMALSLSVVYQIFLPNGGEFPKNILAEFIQWSVFFPAIIVLTGGTLLWMDQLADWAISEIVANFPYARGNDHSPIVAQDTAGEIEPILMKHLERIEIANEGLYQRVAEFLISNRLFREKSMDTANEIENLEKFLREFVGGIRPVVERVSSEQEGLQAAIRKQALELASISKRQGDTATKLEMIDSTLNRLARVNSNSLSQIRSDPKSKGQSGTVVRDLENLLSELAEKSNPAR